MGLTITKLTDLDGYVGKLNQSVHKIKDLGNVYCSTSELFKKCFINAYLYIYCIRQNRITK